MSPRSCAESVKPTHRTALILQLHGHQSLSAGQCREEANRSWKSLSPEPGNHPAPQAQFLQSWGLTVDPHHETKCGAKPASNRPVQKQEQQCQERDDGLSHGATAPTLGMESLQVLALVWLWANHLTSLVLGTQGRSLLPWHRGEDSREEHPDTSGDTPDLPIRFLGSGPDPACTPRPGATFHHCSTNPLSIHVLPLERLPVGRKSAAEMLRDADKEQLWGGTGLPLSGQQWETRRSKGEPEGSPCPPTPLSHLHPCLP